MELPTDFNQFQDSIKNENNNFNNNENDKMFQAASTWKRFQTPVNLKFDFEIRIDHSNLINALRLTNRLSVIISDQVAITWPVGMVID